MKIKRYRDKIKNILLAFLPALIVFGLVFSANTYYDLDLGKVVVDQVTRIVQDLEILTGRIIGKNAEELKIGATDDVIEVVRGGNAYFICDSSGNCAGLQSYTYFSGTGVPGYLAKFTATSTLATSTIFELSGKIGIGTTSPSEKLTVSGNIFGSGNLTIEGISSLATTTISNQLSVEGEAILNGNFQIQGDRTISGTGTLTINPTGNLYLQTNQTYIDDSGNLILPSGNYLQTEKIQFSGNITLSPNSSAGNTKVLIQNSDGSFVADLSVEGDIEVEGGKITLASGETIDAETQDQITINSDGLTIIKSGGAEILRVDSSGVIITGSATTTNTLFVNAGGAKITGSVDIFSGDITVAGKGTFQTSPLTIGKLIFSDSGLTTSTTFTFPDLSDQVVTLNATQTLTNKTLTSPTIQGVVSPGTGLTMPAFTLAGNITGSNYPNITGIGTFSGTNLTISDTANITNLYVSATSTLGSATSTPVIFGGYVQSNIIPYSDATYTLGAQNYRWANLYAATTTIGGTIVIGTNTLEGTATTTFFTTGNTNQLVLGSEGLVGINAIPVSPYNLYVGGQCVTGDTKLRRRKRKNGKYIYDEVQIKDVQPGDEILTLDEKTGKLVWAKVNALMDMGVKEIYKLKTADGREIKTTGNHPYLVKELKGRKPKHTSPIENAGWVLAEQIKEEDFIAAPKPKAGVFIDDANMFYAQRKAGWRVDYKKLKEFLEQIFEVRFLNYYLTLPRHYDSAYLQTQKHLRQLEARYGNLLNIRSKPLKYIYIKEEKRYRKKGNVDGMIAADLLSSIDEIDVAVVLSGDGDLVDIIEPVLRKGKKVLFLGFANNMAWELRQKQHIYFDKIQGLVDSENKNAPDFKTGVPLLLKLYSQQEILSSGKDFVWVKVALIEKVGKEQVYDIEVEGTHNFVANGILAHNTYISATTTIMGNVGIGTTTPAYKLDVDGNLRVSGTTTFGGVTYTWPNNYGQLGYFLKSLGTGEIVWAPIAGAVQGSGVQNRVAFWISASELSYDNNFSWDNTNKRLGIGTTAPAVPLHVISTSEQLRLGYDTENAVRFTVGSSNSLTITPLVNSTTAFNFTNAAGTSIFNIDAVNLRVGIGTTAPARKLDVLDASSDQLQLSFSSSVYGLFKVDSAGDITITPSGDEIFIPDDNLRICSGGSCPTPSYSGTGNLQVEGRIQINESSASPLIVSSQALVTNLNADMVDGKHASSFGLRKSIYLTSATFQGNHNCDDVPSNCCASGYHMCRLGEVRSYAPYVDTIETSGTGRDTSPAGKYGWAEGYYDCLDWTYDGTLENGQALPLYFDGENTYTHYLEGAARCDTPLRVWCCKDY